MRRAGALHWNGTGAMRRSRRYLALFGAIALASVALPMTSALAATSGTGTTSTSLTSGSLSVGSVGSATTLTGTVAGAAAGTLPSVSMTDSTGTGDGWNGTLGVSDLTYTGLWAPVGGATALTTTTSGAFTGTVDGVEYVVTANTILSGAGGYSWTSTDSADPSGSGTAVAATANPVGLGITINFGTQSPAAASEYVIKVGTQSATALSLDSAAGSVTTTSGNTPPVLVNTGAVVTGGGVGATAYSSTAIKWVSAALATGMGTYSLVPGVSVASDVTSWAATYTAGLQYSIVTGP